MKAPDKATIDNLQASCQFMAHLAGQYQVDVRQLKAMGVKWLAKRVKCWYAGSETHLRKFIDRLLYFETDPSYNAGPVESFDSITAFLERSHANALTAHDELTNFRADSFEAEADGTTDIYEHAIQELEYQLKHIEREQRLIAKLGEPGYIGSRLEDG